jgi:hypothetical protein
MAMLLKDEETIKVDEGSVLIDNLGVNLGCSIGELSYEGASLMDASVGTKPLRKNGSAANALFRIQEERWTSFAP